MVTLRLDEPSQSRFEAERRAHFPPGRTAVGAHATLFHALPGALGADATDRLAEVTERFAVRVAGVRSLGRGVAYELSCPPLESWHAQWQAQWREHLTRQDAQPLRLHVTVQNKVTPDEARRTLELLRSGFSPWTARAVALELWEYLGGPWRPIRTFPLLG